jgi:hypothetical protein
MDDGAALPDKLWSAMPKCCGMVPVIGTLVEVGRVELAPYDTTYRSVVIRQEDGTFRDFATVHAIPELSGLVQHDASGTFPFWNSPTECRLAFVYRDDGPRAVDFDAVRVYLERFPKGLDHSR